MVFFRNVCACVCVMLYIKMFKALPALDKQNEKKIEVLRRKKETFFFLSSTKINLKRFFSYFELKVEINIKINQVQILLLFQVG